MPDERVPRPGSRSALGEGWRFAGLHASGRQRRARRSIAPDGTIQLESDRVAGRPRPDDRRPHRGRRLGRARGCRPVRRDASTATSRCDRSSTTISSSRPGRSPVRGDDAYQVAVGPIHAGVIESGHFRFHVVGDRILHLDARLFYKHRGLERAAEGQTLDEGLAYAQTRLRRLRRLELRRLRARLRGDARAAPDRRARARPHDPARARTDLEPPQRHRGRLRRRRPRRRQQLLRCAHRARTPTQRAADRASLPLRLGRRSAAAHLARCHTSTAAREELAVDREPTPKAAGASCSSTLLPGPSARHRRRHAPTTRIALGAVGPAARASGVAEDARANATSARLRRLHDRSSPRRAAGDVQARLEQRAVEAAADLRPARRAARPADRACRTPSRRRERRPIGLGRVESPRGATLCVVEQRRRSHRPSAPAHRLVRQLAGRRPRRRRQPAARLPADQQELRALLRLRRPLMLTLLRRPPPPPPPTRAPRTRPRPQPRASATSTPARATAANTS